MTSLPIFSLFIEKLSHGTYEVGHMALMGIAQRALPASLWGENKSV